MKYLKPIILNIMVVFVLFATTTYLIFHGKMYMDRIMASSEDGSILFIGDLTRTQILGPLYLHSYIFNASIHGKKEKKSINFLSLSRNATSESNLNEILKSDDHETAQSKWNIKYNFNGHKILEINSNTLVGNFVIKTDPNYFRYISTGNGIALFDNKKIELDIISDTMFSPDKSYARVNIGTKILGFIGGFWDDEGNVIYLDLTKVLKKGLNETYIPHSYLISVDKEGKSKKIFGFDIKKDADKTLFMKEDITLLQINDESLSIIGEKVENDKYYAFSGFTSSGTWMRGFLNVIY